MAEALKSYDIHNPKMTDGTEDSFYLRVSFGVPIHKLHEKGKAVMMALMSVEGLEGVEAAGRYSFGLGIARTFDPAKVREEVEGIVKDAAEKGESMIIAPDSKIVTP